MRFFHTADWQIGMKAARLGEGATRARAARLETARRINGLTRERAADFLLLAGDTFEHQDVERHLIREVAAILDEAACPVFVLPGNHDPLEPNSVWEHAVWNETARVHILRSGAPIEIPGGWLLPAPLTQAWSAEDPTVPLAAPTPAGIRVGVAHGALAGRYSGDENGHPIDPGATSRAGLDYLALGHWHSTVIDADSRLAYSGTPEPTRFGERDSGNVLLVEIDSPGAPPRIEIIRTASLTWIQMERRTAAPGDLRALIEELNALPPETTVLDLRLSGLLFAQDRAVLNDLRTWSATLLYGQVDDRRMLPAPEDCGWIEGLPPGVARDTARALQNAAGQGDEDAAQALLLLFRLHAEAGA